MMNIAFIGGDKRQLYSAEYFNNKGYKVYLAGFDKLSSIDNLILTDEIRALNECDIIIFPINIRKDGYIPYYYSEKELNINSDNFDNLKNKIIFTGNNPLPDRFYKDNKILNYGKNEAYAISNALSTAEGAIAIAIENYSDNINGINCLVTGYGRIGKILSRTLKALNSNVYVSTTKTENAEYIISDGNKPLQIDNTDILSKIDILFNTVPSEIINEKVLQQLNKDVLIIDLASLPGGVDLAYANKFNIKVIRALALPGKYSPKASGYNLAKALLTMLKEEYNCQRQI